MNAAEAIQHGKTALGIEFGSTRIKAVLINSETRDVLASGSYSWENRLENDRWTYSLNDAVYGLQSSFRMLADEVRERYGEALRQVGAIGISGMMHGYLPLDAQGRQLAPFLTWRNTNTTRAADELTELFQFNIPLRWSIAHLYQAILEQQPHVKNIAYLTTLAGYFHYRLTGKKVMGVGEASGMFPIEDAAFDRELLHRFDTLISQRGYPWRIWEILPQVLSAGEDAGVLTPEGAILIDPSGMLQPGIPLAPPEGDAGTGMVATNSVDAGSGNVSAGTSIFAMIVLEKRLSRLYRDIDMVTTPSGRPVAMVHCNNGTSELDEWMHLFAEILHISGAKEDGFYEKMFEKSTEAPPDCDGLLLYNYVSGEPVAGLTDGRPLLVRKKGGGLTLAAFMRSQIYSIMASLSIGMRIIEQENVSVQRITGHGGLFKTPGVAQRYLAAAMSSPVSVMQTAGEGGPYGMALLAAYRLHNECSLESYLAEAFRYAEIVTVEPKTADVTGYAQYLEMYDRALALQHTAIQCVD